MKQILLIFCLLVIIFISGCVQTGQITRDEDNLTNLTNVSDAGEQNQTNKTNETKKTQEIQPEIVIDPCEGIVCENSIITCPDGFEAACENECIEGECEICVPDCTGHESIEDIEEDLCELIICEDSVTTCPDGFEASCQNVCDDGVCTTCTPSCAGHECQESWSCTEWGECVSGQQTRVCTDANNCGTEEGKPVETQAYQETEQGNITFSEVYYDTIGSDTKEEWLEIHNPNNQPVNLTGWTITDNSGTWTFPEIIIDPQDYVIIATDQAGFQNLFGCLPDTGAFTRGLNNDGDQLTLKNPEGEIIDFVAWEGGHDDAYPEWDIEANNGKSLTRQCPGKTPTDWLSNQEPEPAC